MIDDERLNHDWVMMGLGRISSHPEANWAQAYIQKLEAETARLCKELEFVKAKEFERASQIAELVEALRPFTGERLYIDPDEKDKTLFSFQYADVRRARAAMTKGE